MKKSVVMAECGVTDRACRASRRSLKNYS